MRRISFVLLCSLVGLLASCGESKNESAPGASGTNAADLGDLPEAGMGPGLDPSLLEDVVETWADAGPTRLRFDDATAASGISARNASGRPGIKEYLFEAAGPGVAWFDYDNDGWMDVFISQGDTLRNYRLVQVPNGEGTGTRPRLVRRKDAKPLHDSLWRNNGDGTFTDVTERARIGDVSWSFGANAADVDGDGWTDLFVSNLGPDRLWHNNGDGTFTDVAGKLGLAGGPDTWSTCAGIADVDCDGRLDIYVGAYLDPAVELERQRLDNKLPPHISPYDIPGRACHWRQTLAYCGPVGLEAQPDTMYRQREDGTFEDVTAAWGLVPHEPKYTFMVGIADFNQDGLPDIYTANDSVENYLFMQSVDDTGTIRFRDRADTMGVKYGHGETPQASMGMAIADINRDGLLDILVTNFSHDYNNIYLGKRVGGSTHLFFRDRGLAVMGTPTYLDLSWGCGWYDYDNDADLDLFIANGHVYKEIDGVSAIQSTYDQYNALFENMDAEHLGFREVGRKAQENLVAGVNPDDLAAGSGMSLRLCSRAAGFCDYDNDGRVDVLVGNMNEPVHVLRNMSRVSKDHHWVKLVPRQPGANRDALGATCTVATADGRKQMFLVSRCTSFVGSDDPRVHVGLGPHEEAEVTVTWPGRDRVQERFSVKAGGVRVLERGKGSPGDD